MMLELARNFERLIKDPNVSGKFIDRYCSREFADSMFIRRTPHSKRFEQSNHLGQSRTSVTVYFDIAHGRRQAQTREYEITSTSFGYTSYRLFAYRHGSST
jgi:hypothetical protein